MTDDRRYYESDDQSFGYRAEGYRDFGVHFATAELILAKNPTSVLDIGGARGYITKRLISKGVPTTVVEKSEHCYQTRAVNSFFKEDIEVGALPFGDGEFDLAFSDSVLEHIHYEKIEHVIKEMARVSKRGLHGIAIKDKNSAGLQEFLSDGTHIIFETLDWWKEQFEKYAPGYEVELSGNLTEKSAIHLPGGIMRKDGSGVNIILNVGSFMEMFYYGTDNLDILDLTNWANANCYKFRWYDARNQKLPYADGTVDMLFSSHFFEHLSKVEGERFLKECLRVLRPGGVIRTAVPDACKLIHYYHDRTIGSLAAISQGVEDSKYPADQLWEILLAGGHKRIFDAESLCGTMRDAGFAEVEVADPFHSRSELVNIVTTIRFPDISLVVDAWK